MHFIGHLNDFITKHCMDNVKVSHSPSIFFCCGGQLIDIGQI